MFSCDSDGHRFCWWNAVSLQQRRWSCNHRARCEQLRMEGALASPRCLAALLGVKLLETWPSKDCSSRS